MKRTIIAMLILVNLSGVSLAQDVTDITEQATEQAESAPAPVEETGGEAIATETAATTTIEAPKAKSPFDLSGYFKVFPLGYNTEDNYVGLQPGLSVSTKVNAMDGKELNITASYDLVYRAFVTTEYREDQAMDFYNTFSLDADIDIADKLNLSLFADIELGFFSELRGNNELWYQAMPKATYKILPTTKVSMAYNFIFDNYPDEILSANDIDAAGPKSEGGGFGLVGSHAGNGGGLGSFATDPAAPDASFNNDLFVYFHELVNNISHNFSDNTSSGLTYTFGRVISNLDKKDTWENKFKVNVSQKLWKKADLKLAYEVRIYDFIYSLADNGIDAQRNFRNRFVIDLSQEINKWFGLEAHYRFQKTLSNVAKARLDPEERHELWVGGVLKF